MLYIDHRCFTIRHVLRGQTQKRINTVANYVSDYCTSYSKGGYKFYPFIRRKESPKLTNFFLSDRAAFCLWTFLISPSTKCLHKDGVDRPKIQLIYVDFRAMPDTLEESPIYSKRWRRIWFLPGSAKWHKELFAENFPNSNSDDGLTQLHST